MLSYAVLYHFEHFLRGGSLARDLLLLPAGGLGFFHTVKLLSGVFQPQVGVGVERDADVGMPHEVLERLWIHARLSLIAAVGVAADVWTCQVWDKKNIFFLPEST